MSKVLVIAEAGVNHNGDIEIAKKLVDAAAAAGADIVKFQTFKAENVVTKTAEKAAYQEKSTDIAESHFEMLKNLELTHDMHVELIDYCEKKGIEFLSTPFDYDSIDELKQLSVKRWKIPSGEITNLPYLEKIAKTDRPTILSTGMSSMDEIEQAVDILRAGGHGITDISILHCNTQYPTPYEDVNLRAMQSIAEVTGLPVGYSDHTCGIEVPIAAVAMGASIIEKHFTLSRDMQGPDHRASLEPGELEKMVTAIRNIEKALGSASKALSNSESTNLGVVRKSIVAKRSIKKGETFSQDNITTKRPGTGISPMRWHDVIGQVAKRDFEADEMIEI